MEMQGKRIRQVAEEAAKLLRENPSWTYKKAIKTAKEILGDEEKQ